MATDGTGGVFQTLAPLFEPGYKVVVRPPKLAQTQPDDPPAYSDPRGILPAGLIPASQISYQLLDQCTERVNVNNFEAAAFTVNLGFNQVIGQVTVNSKSTMALICFEGRDVVDLSTEGLETSDGGLVLPDKVFWPIFAGGKFIGPNDDLGKKASLEFIKKSSANALKGIVPSADAPLDSFSNSDGIFGAGQPNIFDVASNKIALNGGAAFVTYVACDKPLFRDVVTMNSSSICQGRFTGNDFTITLAAPFETPIVSVLRYAFINFETDPQLPARFQWRLSESFGIKADKVETTPKTLTLSTIEKTADFFDTEGKHYVYNLSDVGPDTDKKYPNNPIKQAYSPALAKAKQDATSPFFDKNFKAQIIPFAKNQFFFQSRLEIKSIFGLSPTEGHGSNSVVQTRSYLSPAHTIDLGPKTRLGIEYIRHQFSHTNIFGVDDLIALVSTKPSAEGIGVYYDPCIKMLVVLLAEESTVTQRLFNDRNWSISNDTIPDSKIKAFLLGEAPVESEGPAAIAPFSVDLKLGVTGAIGVVSIPADSVVTAIEIEAGTNGDKPTILELYADKDVTGTPIFEMNIPQLSASVKNKFISVSVAPLAFQGFNISNANGATVKRFFGVKKKFLEDMVAPTSPEKPTDLDRLSAAQLPQNKAADFPLKASGVTAANLSIYGSAFLAYDSQGRIDLAFRTSISAPFLTVRDVCFRVPEDLTTKDLTTTPTVSSSSSTTEPTPVSASKKALPSAAMPFLVPVRQTSSVILFYEYKGRLLAKTIPSTVFNVEDSEAPDGKFTPAVEAKIAAKIQKIIPSVVYDGNITDKKDGIKGDMAFGTIRLILAPATTSSQKNTDKPKVVQHSACRTKTGYIYCFIQDGTRIRVRRSTNEGENWEDVFSDKAVFLPAKKPDTTSSTTVPATDQSVTDGDSPSCFYDQSTETIMLFFIVDSALLMVELAEEILLLPMADADKAIAKLTPVVIYGDVSDNLKSRGVSAQSTVLDRKKSSTTFSETISPHRIAVGRLDGGHLRLFFTDQQKKLRTLISSSGGNLWLTEDQYIKSR